MFNNPDIACGLSLRNVLAKTLIICNYLEKSQLLLLLHGPAPPASAAAVFLKQPDSPYTALEWTMRYVGSVQERTLGEATGEPPLESDVSLQGLPCLRRGFLLVSLIWPLAPHWHFAKPGGVRGELSASAQVSRRAVPENGSPIH